MSKYKFLKYKEFDTYLKNKNYEEVHEKLIILTWKIAYITVMNFLSVDCDCDAHQTDPV